MSNPLFAQLESVEARYRDLGEEMARPEVATHPFFTGKMMLVDTAGMVERYRRRYGMTDPENE